MKQFRSTRQPKPVKEIELSEKHTRVKVIVFIVVLVIAVAAFVIGVVSCLSEDKGWNKVESTAGLDCSDDFTFYCYLESGGTKGHTVLKNVSAVYTQACYDAYRIFDSNDTFDGYNNLAYINAHPNEDITVDPALYNAFSSMAEKNNRALYLAPIYSYYNTILMSTSDDEAAQVYPIGESEAADIFDTVLAFANDNDAIDLKLLGDNTVRLEVSGEYRTFAYTNNISAYIDFFMFRNAFIADYLSDKLKENGCHIGTIASRDGFMRTLDNSEVSSSLGIFDKTNSRTVRAADVSFVGDVAAVRMRGFSLGGELGLYYEFADGTTVSRYIDYADGTVKHSTVGITAYGYGMSCGEVALVLYPIFVDEVFDEARIATLKDSGVYSVYCKDKVLNYNDEQLTVDNLLTSGDVQYTAELI